MEKIKFYQNSFLDEMRTSTDPIADRAVSAIFESDDCKLFRSLIHNLKTNSYQIPTALPEEAKYFLHETRQLPKWADSKLIEKGQFFFKRHATSLSLLLGLLSLPYDYAAADGAQVLLLSERMRYDTGKRLAETGQYVFDVASPGSFLQSGTAIASAQKVRLVHASIRYHIKKLNVWNNQWGEPINQEDMAGTNLSMSLIPIRGMRKLGIQVSQTECLAYIHLWNVASYIMGVNKRLLPDTAKEVFILNKTIVARQFRQSEAGMQLTKSLLDYIKANASQQLKWLAPIYMRFLLGDNISDMLGIPSQSIPGSLVLGPIIYGGKAVEKLEGHKDTYYHARTMYKINSKKTFQEQKANIKLPKDLHPK